MGLTGITKSKMAVKKSIGMQAHTRRSYEISTNIFTFAISSKMVQQHSETDLYSRDSRAYSETLQKSTKLWLRWGFLLIEYRVLSWKFLVSSLKVRALSWESELKSLFFSFKIAVFKTQIRPAPSSIFSAFFLFKIQDLPLETCCSVEKKRSDYVCRYV
jgi:hypothetical protein